MKAREQTAQRFVHTAALFVHTCVCPPSYESDHPSNAGLVQKMVPAIMNLKPRFQAALSGGDEDTVRAYCRIFTEMGESYMSLLMDQQDLNQALLVQVVLECAAVPDQDSACITMNFWYRFINCLENIHDLRFRQMKVDYFQPMLVELIDVCCALMQFPEEINDGLEENEMDELKKNRAFVADTIEVSRGGGGGGLGATGEEQQARGDWLETTGPKRPARNNRLIARCSKGVSQRPARTQCPTQHSLRSRSHSPPQDCCRLLGPDVILVQIGTRIQKVVTAQSTLPPPQQRALWQPLESCLFAVKSISKFIPRDEEKMMPHVMNLIQQYSTDTALHHSFRITTNSLIGGYAGWLKTHPTYLEPFFAFVLFGFNSPLTSESSALAIKHLCESCDAQMGNPVLNLYEQVVSSATVDLRDELYVLEGLCHIMSKQDYDVAAGTLGRVMQVSKPHAHVNKRGGGAIIRRRASAASEQVRENVPEKSSSTTRGARSCIVAHTPPPPLAHRSAPRVGPGEPRGRQQARRRAAGPPVRAGVEAEEQRSQAEHPVQPRRLARHAVLAVLRADRAALRERGAVRREVVPRLQAGIEGGKARVRAALKLPAAAARGRVRALLQEQLPLLRVHLHHRVRRQGGLGGKALRRHHRAFQVRLQAVHVDRGLHQQPGRE